MTIANPVGKRFPAVSEDIRIVQELLKLKKNKKGVPYYNSRVDGKFGPITQKAIEEYQFENNLKITGNILVNSIDIINLRQGLAPGVLGIIINENNEFEKNRSKLIKLNNETINIISNKWSMPTKEIIKLKKMLNGEFIEYGLGVRPFGDVKLDASGYFKFIFVLDLENLPSILKKSLIRTFRSLMRKMGYIVDLKSTGLAKCRTTIFNNLAIKPYSGKETEYYNLIIKFLKNKDDTYRRAVYAHLINLELYAQGKDISNTKLNENLLNSIDNIDFVSSIANENGFDLPIELKGLIKLNKSLKFYLKIINVIDGLYIKLESGYSFDESIIGYLAESGARFVVAEVVVAPAVQSGVVLGGEIGAVAGPEGAVVGAAIGGTTAALYAGAIAEDVYQQYGKVGAEAVLSAYIASKDFTRREKKPEYIVVQTQEGELILTYDEARYFALLQQDFLTEAVHLLIAVLDRDLRKKPNLLYNIIVNHDVIPNVDDEDTQKVLQYIIDYKY